MSLLMVADKLQMNEEKNLLIQGLPSSLEKQFCKLSYAKNLTPLLKNRKIDFALIFSVNQNQLNNILSELLGYLAEEARLWVSYPKTTSKIVTDLNRENSFDYLLSHNFEIVRSVAMDHVWNAVRFKQVPKTIKDRVTSKRPSIEGVDYDKKIVIPPMDLQELLSGHRHASDFFDSLSFGNKTEYVHYIATAKKEDLREQRLNETVEMLTAGMINPTER
jgi:hypothetical protein